MTPKVAVDEDYLEVILAQMPRTLSLMDREVLSPTLGCCDRTYWAWKFVDFPGARFQEALCVLAFVYSHESPDNDYFRCSRLLEWISEGLRFWSKIQRPDGSFDEAYPWERSLAATAFTSFYICEALEFLGDSLSTNDRATVVSALVKAGRWLEANDEKHGFLSNHLSAAAAALYHLYLLTGEQRFQRRCQYFLNRITDHQSTEGWYDEYGGADPGYQSHGSFYLARYWQLSQDETLAESLGRGMEFLAHFAHPDGSFGGQYGSRNTQTYYPAAAEMLAGRYPAASWMADTMRPSVFDASAAGLPCVDVYNYFPFLNNHVFAYLARRNGIVQTVLPREPSPAPGVKWFSDAGIVRVRKARYDAYVGTSKGGVISVFDRSLHKLVYSDAGYIGRSGNGRLVSTQHQAGSQCTHISDDRIRVDGAVFEYKKPVLNPPKFIVFRGVMLTLGRFGGFAHWLKRQLVRVLIYRRKRMNIRFQRTITFDDDRIEVTDHLSGSASGLDHSLQWRESFATIHMGSSRYFQPSELRDTRSIHGHVRRDVRPDEVKAGIEIRRVVSFAQQAD